MSRVRPRCSRSSSRAAIPPAVATMTKVATVVVMMAMIAGIAAAASDASDFDGLPYLTPEAGDEETRKYFLVEGWNDARSPLTQPQIIDEGISRPAEALPVVPS